MQRNYPTVWQLGKASGSIKTQSGGYMVVLSPPGMKQRNTYFGISRYGSQETAKEAAEKYKQEESARLNLNYNRIRYLDANTIEVELSDIYVTDERMENLLEKIKSKGGKLIEGNYITRDSIITIECEQGHKWETKIKYILRGSWCRHYGINYDIKEIGEIGLKNFFDTPKGQELRQQISNFMKQYFTTPEGEKTKQQISNTLIEFNATEKGKELKKASLQKRSETMKIQRDEIRAALTQKTCSCTKCDIKGPQPVANFNNKNDAADGLQPFCRACINKIKREWRERKRQAVAAQQNRNEEDAGVV